MSESYLSKIEPIADNPVSLHVAHKNYFHLLDGIRGLAAILIVTRHTYYFFAPLTSQESYLAVDLFFLLSGVVIANSYEQRMLNGLSWKHFMGLRILRLYPLYILSVFLSIIGMSIAQPLDAPYKMTPCLVVLAFIMVPYLHGVQTSFIYPLNTPTWSLFFELAANFVYARFLNALSNIRLLFIIVLSAIGIIISIILSHPHELNLGWKTPTFIAGFFRAAYPFFLGIFLYRIYTKRVFKESTSRLLPIANLIIIGGLLVFPARYINPPYFDILVALILFPLLVFIAMHSKLGKLGKNICTFAGIASYPVYILQVPIAHVTTGIFSMWNVDLTIYAPWIGFLFAGVLILVSFVLGKGDGVLRKRFLSYMPHLSL